MATIFRYPDPTERAKGPLLYEVVDEDTQYRVIFKPLQEVDAIEGKGSTVRDALNSLLVYLMTEEYAQNTQLVTRLNELVILLLQEGLLSIEEVDPNDPAILFAAHPGPDTPISFFVRQLASTRYEAVLQDVVFVNTSGSAVHVAVRRLFRDARIILGDELYEILLAKRAEKYIEGMDAIGVFSKGKPTGRTRKKKAQFLALLHEKTIVGATTLSMFQIDPETYECVLTETSMISVSDQPEFRVRGNSVAIVFERLVQELRRETGVGMVTYDSLLTSRFEAFKRELIAQGVWEMGTVEKAIELPILNEEPEGPEEEIVPRIELKPGLLYEENGWKLIMRGEDDFVLTYTAPGRFGKAYQVEGRSTAEAYAQLPSQIICLETSIRFKKIATAAGIFISPESSS